MRRSDRYCFLLPTRLLRAGQNKALIVPKRVKTIRQKETLEHCLYRIIVRKVSMYSLFMFGEPHYLGI